LNFSTLSQDPKEGCCDWKLGLAIGGFVDIGIRDTFSFQPEVLFMQKGATTDDPFLDESVSINLDFIEIPLLAKMTFAGTGRARPFVVFGPGLGFNTSASIDDFDIDEDVESMDFSLIFGGGVSVGAAIFEARYDLGLTDLASDPAGSVKSRTFSILVGYGFSR
jgi:hypothetical protein